MARYSFQGTFRDGQGNIVSGGTITVYLAGTDTTATIYEDDTTVTSTSYVESDDNGYFIFYIDSSDYSASQFFDIQLAKSGYTTKLYPSISIVPLWPTDETIEVTDNTTNDVSASAHGWTPKLSDSASDFLDGKGNWDAVSDADLEVTDVTTNNASTSAHGFLKKLDNEATHFMDGTGAWDTVKDSDLALTDITDNDVSTTKHGFAPKLPDDSARFLNGTGNWTTPSGGGGGGSVRQTVLSASISSGVPNFISAGTGLAANIAATTTPIRISFANGFDENGASEEIGSVTEDTSIESLTASTTNYLYAERNSDTGVVTLGATLYQPVYGAAFDDEVSRVSGTAIGNMAGGGNLAASFDGVTSQGFSASSTVAATGSLTGYVGKDWGAGVTKTVKAFTVYGPSDFTGYTNSADKSVTITLQGSTDNFSSSVVDLYSASITPNTTSWIHTVTSGIVVTTPYRYHRVKLVENSGDGGNHTIAIAEVRFYENRNGYFFSIPEMTMYEYVDDVATAKQVVFLGEAVTDESSVTSATNYALRGRYESALTTVASSTAYSFNHNIGVLSIKSNLVLVNQLPDINYTPGQEMHGFVTATSAAPHLSAMTRNNGRFAFSSATNGPDGSSGGLSTLDLTKWKLKVRAERGW